MNMRSQGSKKRGLVVAICLLLLAVAPATVLPGHGVLAAVGQDSAWFGDWAIIGSLDQGFFLSATGIAVDNSSKDTRGTIYVAQPTDHTVRVRAPGAAGWTYLYLSNSFQSYDQPWDVAVDNSGAVYVVNAVAASTERVVWKYAPSTGQWTDLTHGYPFYNARGIAVGSDGTIYVANSSTIEFWELGKVVKLAPNSSSWEAISDPNNAPLFILLPRGIAVDGSGNVYVTDGLGAYDSRLLKYTPGASSWQVIGGGENGILFNGVAADSFGNVYVATTSSRPTMNSHIHMFENGGNVNEARIFRMPGDFKDLRGIAADDQGSIYVTDQTDNGGVISTHEGWATGLAWSTQPGNGTPGQSLAQQPVVRLVGAAGQPITGISGIEVTATLNNANGAALSSATAIMDKGVATFSNLRVDRPGTYSLKAVCTITCNPVSPIVNGWLQPFNPSASIVSGDSAEFTVTDPPAAAPTASPAPGTRVARGWAITLASTTQGATIRYTTDGSDPGPGSPRGTGGTEVTVTGELGGAFTIKAYASAEGWSDSPISTFTYHIYSQDEYTVTFMDGGAVYATRTVPAGTAVGSATWPETAKPGYTFGGWFTTGGLESKADTIVEANTTLYARYTPINYTLTYNLNGGTLDSANPTSYNADSAAITLNNPTREHYEFTGWSGTGIEGNPALSVTIAQGSLGNRSYTAHWEPVSYSISYNLAGGAVDPANPESYTVETADFTLQNPTRPGYTFAGWSGTGIPEGEQPSSVTITRGSSGARTYTAHWTAVNYSITYNLAGGSAANPESYTVESDEITLNNPTREHYHFAGWSGTGIAGDPSLSVIVARGSSGARAYTAHWTAIIYSIDYNLAGGSAANPITYTVESGEITLNNPTRQHYHFTGWSGTDIEGGPALSVTIAQGSLGVRSYTAHWEPVSYSIVYDLKGGAVDPANPESYTVETAAFTLQNPTRPGYTFAGWSGTGIAGDPSLSVIIAQGSSGARAYTAHWAAVNYSITYDLAGGSAANPESYTVESDEITLNNPTREHYEFTGWSGTDIEGDPVLNVTIAQGSLGDRSYTAHWEPVSYSIVYDLKGGTMDPANPESYTVETANFTLQNPTRPGYIFLGWRGSGLQAAEKVVVIPRGSTGDRSYTATWRKVVIKNLPGTYTMFKGGSVTWEGKPGGGAWDWDRRYFSATFNSPATFKALKAGRSTITYTVEGVEHRISVTVKDKPLPGTGHKRTWIWVLLAAATLLAAGIWAKFRTPIKDRSE